MNCIQSFSSTNQLYTLTLQWRLPVTRFRLSIIWLFLSVSEQCNAYKSDSGAICIQSFPLALILYTMKASNQMLQTGRQMWIVFCIYSYRLFLLAGPMAVNALHLFISAITCAASKSWQFKTKLDKEFKRVQKMTSRLSGWQLIEFLTDHNRFSRVHFGADWFFRVTTHSKAGLDCLTLMSLMSIL